MGFSVSGSAAIVFAGLFIAFGMWHTAATNSFERVSEAQSDRTEDMLAVQNTDVVIERAEWDESAEQLTVEVRNAGATELTVSGTDLLVDNDFETGWESGATVDGDGDTDLWLPQETLTITVSETTQPNQVKVVADTGVGATSGVTVV